ncbi:MAG: cupin domain-containing protein [Devosia sp.]
MIAEPQRLELAPGTTMPNSRLPVLIYRTALPTAAADFAALFRQNGWTGIWHDGVYDFDHYHSNAHEVLGVSGGGARLQLGGPEGTQVDLSAGDCVVLPAGTGHRCVRATGDFRMVGAYPPGQERYDICRTRTPEAELRIARVTLPETDPVRGADGPLLRAWSS